ncbi:hypothetical protein KA012_04725 [Candidatus Woesebacteria bacterium]|nr:hypothetical protein [Candidatus Woesebacteria bacterium]
MNNETLLNRAEETRVTGEWASELALAFDALYPEHPSVVDCDKDQDYCFHDLVFYLRKICAHALADFEQVQDVQVEILLSDGNTHAIVGFSQTSVSLEFPDRDDPTQKIEIVFSPDGVVATVPPEMKELIGGADYQKWLNIEFFDDVKIIRVSMDQEKKPHDDNSDFLRGSGTAATRPTNVKASSSLSASSLQMGRRGFLAAMGLAAFTTAVAALVPRPLRVAGQASAATELNDAQIFSAVLAAHEPTPRMLAYMWRRMSKDTFSTHRNIPYSPFLNQTLLLCQQALSSGNIRARTDPEHTVLLAFDTEASYPAPFPSRTQTEFLPKQVAFVITLQFNPFMPNKTALIISVNNDPRLQLRFMTFGPEVTDTVPVPFGSWQEAYASFFSSKLVPRPDAVPKIEESRA